MLYVGVEQGRWCAERPVKVLAVCVLGVALAALGLLRLRVETDPQRLWVGFNSQALAEKRHFEVHCEDRANMKIRAQSFELRINKQPRLLHVCIITVYRLLSIMRWDWLECHAHNMQHP